MLSTTTAPVGPDVNLSYQYLIPCGILAVISFGLCAARIFTRCRPVFDLRLSDYLIIGAEICSFFGYVTIVVATAYGWGRQSYYVPVESVEKSLQAGFAVQILWTHGITLVRFSIAFSLLPLSQNRFWKAILYILIGLQVVLYVGWMNIMIFKCLPVRGNWQRTIHMKCWPRKYTTNAAWCSAPIFIIMDLTMALMPIRLIRSLNRPRSEKILVGALMALGILTTATVGAKMSAFPSVYKGDPLQGTVISSLLAKLEEQVGIICACLPTLKGPAERLLIRIGVSFGGFQHTMTRPSFVLSTRNQNVPAVHKNNQGDVGLMTYQNFPVHVPVIVREQSPEKIRRERFIPWKKFRLSSSQLDYDGTQDRAEEISKIVDMYGNATVTFAAAHGSSVEAGCVPHEEEEELDFAQAEPHLAAGTMGLSTSASRVIGDD
ncbi:hypothetical protein GLAREA_13035 [Glarea lozoyensis ATCC 20868]|uniref:Rhodopsin domain-containing protein n=1 Tax=Glarea lozoyensis (strain ATCC 20868 / MF5171) TaxID=1116229 RepID=S3CV99_GLAL2|nr:uncharacterized protein GLAREA_13035 [Glarea lozoyensis ATCC 20868]EPE30312.1 hypothetical protein GLAREA_13035 [Glarea lozoyensis ATCC 20868]